VTDTPPTPAPVDGPAGPELALAGDLVPEIPEPVELDDDAAVIALADLPAEQAAGLEALLFLAEEPQDVLALGEVLDLAPEAVDAACQGLAVRHRRDRRGTEVRRAAGGWRMYSSALARPVLERWALSGRSGRLTQAALETLAVIAYKQPISRSDIGEVRGVNADGAVRSLVARGFVTEVGRDDGPGQAVLYGTTVTFLERLGLDHVDDLPPMTDFLPEHQAPDEPELSRLKEVRAKLAAGGELPGPGSAEDTRAAATRRFGDVRARLAVAGSEDAVRAAALDDDGDLEGDDALPPPVSTRHDRRSDEAEMDELTDRLESAARSAVDRLRQAVDATAARDADDLAADDLAADDPVPDAADDPVPDAGATAATAATGDAGPGGSSPPHPAPRDETEEPDRG
jgi:segregation and condensation protein B